VWLCAKFKYQKATSLLIPKTSFQRPVKEIAEDYQVHIRGFALSHQFNWWLPSWIRIKALQAVLANILFSI
jgi:hypothetical protein